jgi:hypothetical protein
MGIDCKEVTLIPHRVHASMKYQLSLNESVYYS